jgi:hypothetical protein
VWRGDDVADVVGRRQCGGGVNRTGPRGSGVEHTALAASRWRSGGQAPLRHRGGRVTSAGALAAEGSASFGGALRGRRACRTWEVVLTAEWSRGVERVAHLSAQIGVTEVRLA